MSLSFDTRSSVSADDASKATLAAESFDLRVLITIAERSGGSDCPYRAPLCDGWRDGWCSGSQDDEAAGPGAWGPESVMSAWREEERYAAAQPEPALVPNAGQHVNNIHADIEKRINKHTHEHADGRGSCDMHRTESAAVVTPHRDPRDSRSWRRTPSAQTRQGVCCKEMARCLF